VQFVRLGNAVVVFVDPKKQMWEYGVAPVDNPIPVTAVLGFVEFR
jgi:hypothetical protein